MPSLIRAMRRQSPASALQWTARILLCFTLLFPAAFCAWQGSSFEGELASFPWLLYTWLCLSCWMLLISWFVVCVQALVFSRLGTKRLGLVMSESEVQSFVCSGALGGAGLGGVSAILWPELGLGHLDAAELLHTSGFTVSTGLSLALLTLVARSR